MSTWRICLTEIPEEKHLRLSDYLNQILGPQAQSLKYKLSVTIARVSFNYFAAYVWNKFHIPQILVILIH